MSGAAVSKTILHIDDDPDDRELLQDVVKSLDPSVVVLQAENGKIGIEILQFSKLEGNLPNLIILDLNMPIMNSYETYVAINKDEELSAIPLILFTTSITFLGGQNWNEKQITMYVKPASYKDYKDRLKNILNYSNRLSTH